MFSYLLLALIPLAYSQSSLADHHLDIVSNSQGLDTSFSVDVDVDVDITPDVTPFTTHRVEVGAHGDLIFSPNHINAAQGDVIEFQFLQLNHTLTQSSLEKPCLPNGGLDTGFTHFNPNNRTDDIFLFSVQSINPQWFFCKQDNPKSHCHAGMVFSINPGDNFDKFLEGAQEGARNSKKPAQVVNTDRQIVNTLSTDLSTSASVPESTESTTKLGSTIASSMSSILTTSSGLVQELAVETSRTTVASTTSTTASHIARRGDNSLGSDSMLAISGTKKLSTRRKFYLITPIVLGIIHCFLPSD